MSEILTLLLKVHDSVHVFEDQIMPKKPYSEPKLYTGGIDLKTWNKLTTQQKQDALSKDWYLWYSYRHPDGKLKRMPNIKGFANTHKTKEERFEILNTLRINLKRLLKSGFNPLRPDKFTDADSTSVENMTVKQAFDEALRIKKKVLNNTSYPVFKGRVDRFYKWLKEHGFEYRAITSITVHTVNKYLNEILDASSAANRNNTRLDISALFSTLTKEFIIPENFVLKIGTLKSTPEKNKSYTTTQETDIFKYMESNDPLLALFVKFVSYNFLRPVEVCRLLIQDIDIKDQILNVRTKGDPDKIKIIPEILLKELPDLKKYNKKDFLFTPAGPGQWETSERDRRGYFGKRFAKIKEHFKLGNEYNMYSFRHTFITRLYSELVKTKTPDEAESYLMLITGHGSREALRKYLRDIDAYRPEDYSKHLTKRA